MRWRWRVSSAFKEERLYLLTQFSFEDLAEGVFGEFFADFEVFRALIGGEFPSAKFEKLLLIHRGPIFEGHKGANELVSRLIHDPYDRRFLNRRMLLEDILHLFRIDIEPLHN